RAERLRDLHRERSEASGGTVDQDLVTWLDLPLIAKQLEGGGGGYPNGRGLLEHEVRRFCHEVIGRGAHVRGKGARAPAEHLIAWLHLRHPIAARLDRPRHIRSRNPVLWLAQSVGRARD